MTIVSLKRSFFLNIMQEWAVEHKYKADNLWKYEKYTL